MPIPIAFDKHLERISNSFGGVSLLKATVPESSLQYILSYPGFVHISKPWSAKIDLVESGFIPGSKYTVCTKRHRKIYSRRSESGLFGETVSEQALISQAAHGDYWLISFDSETKPVTGLIWICNRVSPDVIKDTIDSWNSQTKVLASALDQHEAFINTDKLLKTDIVRTYFLPGSWGQHLTTNEIKADVNVKAFDSLADGVISLYPKQTGWYLFELKRDDEDYFLSLENIKGPATNRIRVSKSNSYFVELGANSSTTKGLSRSLLPSLSKVRSVLLNVDFIHLEATLEIVDRQLVSSISTAEGSYVIKKNLVPAVITCYSTASIGVTASQETSDPTTEVIPVSLTSVYQDNVNWDDVTNWEQSVSYEVGDGYVVDTSYSTSTASIED